MNNNTSSQQNQNNPPQRPDRGQVYIKDLARVIDGELDRMIPDNHSKWFGSIEYRPRSMTFGTQNEEETIYLLLRRHWIKNLGWVINNIIYSFIPIIILLLLDRFNVPLEFLSFKIYLIIIFAFYSVIFTNVLRNFFDWYFDVYIVTNERVLSYEFKPFVSYTILEAELDSIQDVQESAKGIIADLFNYGDLEIRTAAHFGELFFEAIPDPTQVRNILMDLVDIIMDYKNAGPRP